MNQRQLTFALSLAVLAAGGAAAAPEFDVAKEDERQKLTAIEQTAAAGDEAAVYAMDDLLARLARTTPVRDAKNVPGDMLLEEPVAAGATGVTMRSVRALALDVARRLPAPIRKKLIAAQKDAEATERSRGTDDETVLVRRFPFAPDAAPLAWRLAQRAFDEGDETAALSWDRLAAKLAALQLQTQPPPFAAHARRAAALIRAGDLDAAEGLLQRVAADAGAAAPLVALLRARIARVRSQQGTLEARRPPEGLLPDLFASYQLNKAESSSTTPAVLAPPVAAHTGDLVFACDGSRLVAVDARSGELRGRLPQDDPKVAPPATGLPGLVTALGDLVLTPLFCEKLVLPSRAGQGDGRANRSDPDSDDPAVRGGYFSLFAYDARALRLLWWDGDAPGTVEDNPLHGRPAGTDALDDRGWKFYASKHVVGRPLLDGRRVYVPLASSLAESQLWVVAFERQTGEGGTLVLVPIWKTFISLSGQPSPNQAQNLIVPSVNPRLALDAEGRLFVQTDQGVLAALDVRTGGIDWVHRSSDEDSARAARGRQSGAGYRPTSDPPVPFPSDGTRPAVVVVASPEEERWLGLSSDDGSVVWRSETWSQMRSGGFTQGRGEGPRVLALTPTVALGYGGQSFVALDAFTGAILVEPNKVRAVRLEDQERLAGAAVPAGPGLLLLPTDQGRVRKLSFREETRPARRIELTLGEELGLQGVGQHVPLHLIALEGRLVVTTPARVLVYTWVPRNE